MVLQQTPNSSAYIALTFTSRTYTILSVSSLTSSAYPTNLESTRKTWRGWARSLQRLGLAGLIAGFLESGSAFATLAAQGLYISQPLLEPLTSKQNLGDLILLLESPAQTAEFTQLLKEEKL